jgi:voltage-gated potassium channel
MEALKKLVDGEETRISRVFNLGIQFLIIASLISFSIETIEGLDKDVKRYLGYFETFSILIFTVEYILRLIAADKKLKFVFSFYGLVDLLAILPFYVARGLDLRAVRAVRIFRLLRLLRAFKIFRYTKASGRLKEAFVSVKEELVLFMIATVIIIFISAVGIYYFEHDAQPKGFQSVFHCMWWAVATLTTVGYGDVYPVTVAGKIFTFIMLIAGMGIIAMPTGLIASALTNVKNNEQQTKESCGGSTGSEDKKHCPRCLKESGEEGNQETRA